MTGITIHGVKKIKIGKRIKREDSSGIKYYVVKISIIGDDEINLIVFSDHEGKDLEIIDKNL